ncbi:MAG: OadG family transporter subunit, partial [Propionicimonas sp.]
MENFAWGVWMTVVGMGTVFLLLLLLMLVLRGIGWIDQRGARRGARAERAPASDL